MESLRNDTMSYNIVSLVVLFVVLFILISIVAFFVGKLQKKDSGEKTSDK